MHYAWLNALPHEIPATLRRPLEVAAFEADAFFAPRQKRVRFSVESGLGEAYRLEAEKGRSKQNGEDGDPTEFVQEADPLFNQIVQVFPHPLRVGVDQLRAAVPGEIRDQLAIIRIRIFSGQDNPLPLHQIPCKCIQDRPDRGHLLFPDALDREQLMIRRAVQIGQRAEPCLHEQRRPDPGPGRAELLRGIIRKTKPRFLHKAGAACGQSSLFQSVRFAAKACEILIKRLKCRCLFSYELKIRCFHGFWRR